MGNPPEHKGLIFDWFISQDSNFWRLLGFSIISLICFAAVYYFLDIAEQNTTPPAIDPQQIITAPISNENEPGYFSKALAKDYFLLPTAAESGAPDPNRYELPIAQHQLPLMPKLAEITEVKPRLANPSLLVSSIPVLPSSPHLESPPFDTQHMVNWKPEVRFSLSEELKDRYQGGFSDEVAKKLLAAEPFLKILIGLDSQGGVHFQLPLTSIESNPSIENLKELVTRLKFSPTSKKPKVKVANSGLVWGHLIVSWSEARL